MIMDCNRLQQIEALKYTTYQLVWKVVCCFSKVEDQAGYPSAIASASMERIEKELGGKDEE
jgi:hypothetical protein